VSHINLKEDTLGRRGRCPFNNRNCCVFCFVSRRLFCFFFSKKEDGEFLLYTEIPKDLNTTIILLIL